MDQVGPNSFRLSAMPRVNREAYLRELIEPALNITMDPLDSDIELAATFHKLANVLVMVGHNSPSVISRRSTDIDDSLEFVWTRTPGKGRIEHCGRTMETLDGSAVLASGSEAYRSCMRTSLSPVIVRFPRAAFQSLVPRSEDLFMRPVELDNSALRLLKAYLGGIVASGPKQAGAFAETVSNHIIDLIALSVGTLRDESEFARTRTIRPVMLTLAKEWVRDRLGDPSLDVGKVAAAHGISRRKLQMLFGESGTTFSRYLAEVRLDAARAKLQSPLSDHLQIGQIAYACGFGDLSNFNRTFRARHGMTPGECRTLRPTSS